MSALIIRMYIIVIYKYGPLVLYNLVSRLIQTVVFVVLLFYLPNFLFHVVIISVGKATLTGPF